MLAFARKHGMKDNESDGYDATSGTSIFDPVLCGSPTAGSAGRRADPDPFAGGSARGIVASKLGRQYIGHELRQEQVETRTASRAASCAAMMNSRPHGYAGTAATLTRPAPMRADMVFSCPPYADLEVYSDDPKDLSTMKYSELQGRVFEIIKKACDRLKPDSFACFVVGEVRDKNGNYIDFVGDTVQAFRDAGLHYYNEAILITCVGSLPIRAGKHSVQAASWATHQNILVFIRAAAARPPTAAARSMWMNQCLTASRP